MGYRSRNHHGYPKRLRRTSTTSTQAVAGGRWLARSLPHLSTRMSRPAGQPEGPPDSGASPVPRGARPAAASIRHTCSPLRVAAPARRHELPDPQLRTRRFGQGRDVVGLGRWSFPTPHTNRTGREEARTGLPVLVTPTRRRHRVTQPFSRLLGGIWGDAAFPNLTGGPRGEINA